MGDHFQTIVDLDATAAEAPRLVERTDRSFGHHLPGPHWDRAVDPADVDREPSDGLTVHTGRTSFHGGHGEPEWVRCPRCTTTTRRYADEYDRIDTAWEPYGTAMDRWHTSGAADVTCPAWATSVPLPDRTWAHDHFAFAHLGLGKL
ncbi:hypothetical protein [Streptomyces sp. NPDC007856]|uniref:hypothetical protein n=1 Tax=Streptomyces sp. NPDC007856 TaxID=3364781 RepID=UPI0036A03B1D